MCEKQEWHLVCLGQVQSAANRLGPGPKAQLVTCVCPWAPVLGWAQADLGSSECSSSELEWEGHKSVQCSSH